VNSKLFRPLSACAKHARIRCVIGCLFWPLGMAILLLVTFPVFSQGASISGTVFVDLDTDGVYKAGDWGVRGDTIQLFDQNGVFLQETSTNNQGQYFFKDLAIGNYTVKNLIPSLLGNSAIVGQMLNASNALVPGTFGTPNSALVQISDIALKEGFQAINYNFGNDQYPMQLYSKYMLVSDVNHEVQPAIVTPPVPEPTLTIQLLAIFGMISGWALYRRLQTMS
jgi:hypothetical protein